MPACLDRRMVTWRRSKSTQSQVSLYCSERTRCRARQRWTSLRQVGGQQGRSGPELPLGRWLETLSAAPLARPAPRPQGQLSARHLGSSVNTMLGKSLVLCAAAPILAFALARTPSPQAVRHIGEAATVCGPVADVHYAPRSRGGPTFLDFDAAYPNQDVVVVVWGEDAAKFGDLQAYEGRTACASGVIRAYRACRRLWRGGGVILPIC